METIPELEEKIRIAKDEMRNTASDKRKNDLQRSIQKLMRKIRMERRK